MKLIFYGRVPFLLLTKIKYLGARLRTSVTSAFNKWTERPVAYWSCSWQCGKFKPGHPDSQPKTITTWPLEPHHPTMIISQTDKFSVGFFNSSSIVLDRTPLCLKLKPGWVDIAKTCNSICTSCSCVEHCQIAYQHLHHEAVHYEFIIKTDI